jgi:hypothetical protein
MLLSSIMSALISCNFMIKNDVNRKITSYIYLLIFTKSLWLHFKHFIALTKRESVRRIFFCNYRSKLPLSTHWPVTTRNTGKYDSIGDKKKTCVRIKRVKSDSYLTYGQSCKTYLESYVDTPPPKKKPSINLIYKLLTLYCSWSDIKT